MYEWVVYAKPPFSGPAQGLKYLARYTHRVAISNRRLLGLENGKVTFRWKDYTTGNIRNGAFQPVAIRGEGRPIKRSNPSGYSKNGVTLKMEFSRVSVGTCQLSLLTVIVDSGLITRRWEVRISHRYCLSEKDLQSCDSFFYAQTSAECT